MTECSPGPFRREVWNGIHQVVVDADGNSVAFDVQGEANANLFVGSPDLLVACEMVPRLLKEIRGFASDLFGGESSLTDCIDLVLSETEAAIAKARGEAC